MKFALILVLFYVRETLATDRNAIRSRNGRPKHRPANPNYNPNLPTSGNNNPWYNPNPNLPTSGAKNPNHRRPNSQKSTRQTKNNCNPNNFHSGKPISNPNFNPEEPVSYNNDPCYDPSDKNDPRNSPNNQNEVPTSDQNNKPKKLRCSGQIDWTEKEKSTDNEKYAWQLPLREIYTNSTNPVPHQPRAIYGFFGGQKVYLDRKNPRILLPKFLFDDIRRYLGLKKEGQEFAVKCDANFQMLFIFGNDYSGNHQWLEVNEKQLIKKGSNGRCTIQIGESNARYMLFGQPWFDAVCVRTEKNRVGFEQKV